MYSFIEPQAYNMVSVIYSFESHVFKGWRNGWKTKRIIEEWHFPVTEEDVQIAFRTVFDEYFKEA